MNLEDQVTNLELSKKLKEIGVKQESLVYWLNVQHSIHMKVKENGWEVEVDENGNGIIDRVEYRTELGSPFAYNVDKNNCWSAFTVTELGEMLPEHYISCKTEGIKSPLNKYKKYWLCYYDDDGVDSDATQMEEKEADARAKMLIHLIENNLIEVPK